MDHLVRATGTPGLLLVTLTVLAAATHVGRVVGRRRRPFEDKDAATLATGMLGIFALLIAFSYSLSLARYDARRAQVLAEANAIGSTANYATMVPPPHRARTLALLRAYAARRLALGVPYEEATFAREIAAGNAIMAKLWVEAQAVVAADPQSLPAHRFVTALSEQSNVAEARVTALRNHVPAIVLVMLVLVAAAALGLGGYAGAIAGLDRHVGLAIMAVTITFLIGITIDLDRPNRGAIDVSKQPLVDMVATLPPV